MISESSTTSYTVKKTSETAEFGKQNCSENFISINSESKTSRGKYKKTNSKNYNFGTNLFLSFWWTLKLLIKSESFNNIIIYRKPELSYMLTHLWQSSITKFNFVLCETQILEHSKYSRNKGFLIFFWNIFLCLVY